MKITLWQQFSSNHSASFTVVGEFQSTVEAESAESYLRELFENIKETREALDLYPADPQFPPDPPTWAEVAASERYGISWHESIDWIRESIDDNLHRYENYVIVTTDGETHQCSSEIIEALIQKMAKNSFVQSGECSEDRIILVELKCDATDARTQEEVVGEIERYLNPKTVEGSIPPWEIFSQTIYLQYFGVLDYPFGVKPNPKVVRAAIGALYAYQDALVTKQRIALAENATIAALQALLHEGYNLHVPLNTETLNDILRDVGSPANACALGGKVESSGQTLHIVEIVFFQIQYGLPALIAYLQDRGYIDIRYSLQSVPYLSRPEYL